MPTDLLDKKKEPRDLLADIPPRDSLTEKVFGKDRARKIFGEPDIEAGQGREKLLRQFGLPTRPEEIKTELVSPVLSGASTAAFGLPKAAIKKFGGEGLEEKIFPEQTTGLGKTLRLGSEVRGIFKGGAATLAKKIGDITFKKTGSALLKGAAEGATFGGSQFAGDDISLEDQAVQAGVGATFGTFLGFISKAKKGIDKATKGAPGFLRKVRGAVFQRKRQASEQFGSQLEDLSRVNPNRKVSLRQVVEKINSTAAEEPKLKSIINRTPSIKRISDNPQLADTVPVEEAQRIINDLTAKLPSSKKLGFNVTSDDIAIFDVIDDIRGSQLDAFPEMAEIRQSYSQVINKYNLIKGKIKAGSLQSSLIKDFGDRELKEAFEELVPSDILKEVKEFRRIHGALDFTGRVGRRAAEGAAIVGAGGLVGKKLGLFGGGE
ncbi:MAG: hypothetical protein KKE05_04300 [Nanoarchaeota archaeon]|nr:hypothetical protein [Nanoarchaeota archaeon]